MNTLRLHPNSSDPDPMNLDARTALMHSVLDGTADAEHVQALDALLASDAGAAEEFAAWKSMFRALSAMPMEHPPEGLVAAIGTAVPAGRKSNSNARQLFSGVPVLVSGQAQQLPSSFKAFFRRPGRSEPSQEFGQMNASRKIWAGGAVAAVALGIVVLATGYPPKAEDLTGTVAPAERYRAPQAGGDAIKLGDQSAPSTATTPAAATGTEAAKADAAKTDASLVMQKTDAQLRAEKANASLVMQKTDAQLRAEKANASLVMQKTDAQLRAEKANASLVMQKTDAQLRAEKADAARVMLQKTDAQMQAEKSAQKQTN